MRKKNLLVVCAAFGLCLIFVLLLVGSMGIYAEKTGTQEFEPEMAESETQDMLTELLVQDSETDAGNGNDLESGGMTEEELKGIWENMYREYDGSEETHVAADETEQDATEIQFQFVSLDDAKLGIHEAGLIFLKEINRLYPNDSLKDLKIAYLELDYYSGENVVYWAGKLENGFGDTEEAYRSYTCQIDSISGKMVSFGKFRPYQKEKDYAAISWTEEEIKARAKQLIDEYGLFAGEELNWESVTVNSGKECIDTLKDDFAERPNLSRNVCNTLVFEKNGVPSIYFCIDWETGEFSNYLW